MHLVRSAKEDGLVINTVIDPSTTYPSLATCCQQGVWSQTLLEGYMPGAREIQASLQILFFGIPAWKRQPTVLNSVRLDCITNPKPACETVRKSKMEDRPLRQMSYQSHGHTSGSSSGRNSGSLMLSQVAEELVGSLCLMVRASSHFSSASSNSSIPANGR